MIKKDNTATPYRQPTTQSHQRIGLSRLRKRKPTQAPTPELPDYYVFIVTGGIDPILHRQRFTTRTARDRYMKDIYASDVDEESGDLPCFLNVSPRGTVTMGYYSREWFETANRPTALAPITT